MSRQFPWTILGIEATQDTAAIRKAYANALRSLNVDEDIAGYANLRRARDEALWLAAQDARADNEDFGLGGLGGDDDDWDVGFYPRLNQGSGETDSDWLEPPHDASLAPDLSPDLSPDLNDAQRRAQDAWQALLDILFPDGEASEDSVTYAEMEAGLGHLDVLLAHADQVDLIEHDALDGALADVFARTWPRSAPFVEPANAALNWLDEAGQLEERPALMFLNQRIKGMQFHEKVQAPGHPLNAAWIELSRPGRATVLDRLRIKRLEVDKLLTGIRERFPELESLLDPQRVASWEGSNAGHAAGPTGPSTVRWISFVLLALFILPRFIPDFIDPRPDDPAAATAPQFDTGPSEDEIDADISDIFGPGIAMQEVRAADPVFADQLRNAFNRSAYSEGAPLAFVRRKALEAGEVAEFEALIARSQLRRMWLATAQRQAPAMCQNVLAGDFFSLPLGLNDVERINERALLRKLLTAAVLNHQAKGGETRFSIPGWMVSEAITRSGLSNEAFTAALGNTSDANRCAVEIALLDIIIANPGRVPVELLRGL